MYLPAFNDGWGAEMSLASLLWRNCHERPDKSLGGDGGRSAHEVYIETELYSSYPGFNDVRAQNYPIKGTHLKQESGLV